jgi:hypothetical protein
MSLLNPRTALSRSCVSSIAYAATVTVAYSFRAIARLDLCQERRMPAH